MNLGLREFYLAYKDFIRDNDLQGVPPRAALQKSLTNPCWKIMSVSLARVIAATPHSCDVERLISPYNRMKTPDRSRLSSEVLNDYLHVMINMPDLSHYNAWPAVNLWLSE